MGRILVDNTTKYDFGIPAEVRTWKDDPAFALSPEDFVTRPGRTITRAVIHTTLGLPCLDLFDGPGAKGPRAENVAAYWRRNKTSAATPIIVDHDGSVVQTHYLGPIVAWHAKGAGFESVGIELVQSPGRGALYRAQFDTAGDIIAGFIHSGFPFARLLTPGGVLQVRTSYPEKGRPVKTVSGWRGVEGHCHASPEDRGVNDPGMEALKGIANRLYDHGLTVERL